MWVNVKGNIENLNVQVIFWTKIHILPMTWFLWKYPPLTLPWFQRSLGTLYISISLLRSLMNSSIWCKYKKIKRSCHHSGEQKAFARTCITTYIYWAKRKVLLWFFPYFYVEQKCITRNEKFKFVRLTRAVLKTALNCVKYF